MLPKNYENFIKELTLDDAYNPPIKIRIPSLNSTSSWNKAHLLKRTGFGKLQNSSPSKILVTDLALIDFLTEMARVANIPYCFPQNNMWGPEMTRSQWEKRKNILSKQESKYGGRVDSKFCTAPADPNLQYVIIKVMTLATTVSGSKMKLIFTGHGIGGAYAFNTALTILTLEKAGLLTTYQFNRKFEMQVITFGQPRLGNNKFVEMIHKEKNQVKIYRVTNGNDYVSQFPKKTKDNKQYWHIDTEYWIPGIEDCDCGSMAGQKNENGLYRVYQCPGYFPNGQKQFGENLECNAGTDGSSNFAHFGPWFGTTFGNCQHFLPVK
ncbi:hypothetical protein G9A89_020448 [Geosiphon pyriformis]|nr:hypothetical protein G9A89_020448 [Geosiphon pyriformis]